MKILDGIKNWLIGIVPMLCVVRILYCLNQINADENEAPAIWKRIKNTVKFLIIAICIMGMVTLINSYFGSKPIF